MRGIEQPFDGSARAGQHVADDFTRWTRFAERVVPSPFHEFDYARDPAERCLVASEELDHAGTDDLEPFAPPDGHDRMFSDVAAAAARASSALASTVAFVGRDRGWRPTDRAWHGRLGSAGGGGGGGWSYSPPAAAARGS